MSAGCCTAPASGPGVAWLRFHELLVEFGPAYLERFGPAMPARQREVLERVLACRTPELGGSLFACAPCGSYHYAYHSCNDRHCPLCGQTDAEAWLEQHQRLLLPVPYFLVTFTVPEALRPWLRAHPQLGYGLLFQASARAVQDLAWNPKRLGASVGLLGLLHTWSRTLSYHPHVHYLVPGGGLSRDQRTWVACPNKFLLPVKALSDHVRTLFKKALQEQAPEALQSLPAKIWKQRWVVHSQAAGSGENALRYLSRYVFQTATGNRTLRRRPDGRVRWPYRDSASRQWRHLDLEPFELIRRYLQHVLPAGFHRVRLFGFLHPAGRNKLKRVRALLKAAPLLSEAERQAWPAPEELEARLETETDAERPRGPLCPRCQRPMDWVQSWRPGQPVPPPPARAPP
jgi:hypothetical protein